MDVVASARRDATCRKIQDATKEEGQALILVVLAMVMILAMSAFAIDVAGWYQTRHQAQVAADAAALAAANCLNDYRTTGNACTSTTDTTNAYAVATTIATANHASIGSISDNAGSVTVTTAQTAPSVFGGIAHLTNVQVSAKAVATLKALSDTFSCPSSGSSSCYSLFAGNPNCPSSSTSKTVGLSLVIDDSGGGHSHIPDAYTNGYTYVGANSSSSNFGITTPGSTSGGPTCATSNEAKPSNTSFTYTTGTVPYPAVWDQPGCDSAHTATYWTTSSTAPASHQITTPGTYCVSTSAAPSCTESASGMSAGYLYLDESSPLLTSGGAYEFVSPCTTIAGSGSATITSVSGQPLVYGTANIITYATTTALPTCTAATNNGSAGSDVYIDGNGASVGWPIFDQCGTVEFTKNNDFLGYIEAWNIIQDKNNSATGNGPTSPSGGGTTVTPAGDVLSQ